MIPKSSPMLSSELAAPASPYAIVLGQPLSELPKDLYIPPLALKVFLETFTGPLDLLLYLIRRDNLDILNIPIAKITAQYVEYVELMRELNLELAADYLVMAAVLAEIKSKLLLPIPPSLAHPEEEDPRAALVRRLREYEIFKKAAEDLDNLPRLQRDIFATLISPDPHDTTKPIPPLLMQELLHAFTRVMERLNVTQRHRIFQEKLSVRERMSHILSTLQSHTFVSFETMFPRHEGRMGVIVTFIAILELLKQSLIEIVQNELYSTIYLRITTQES